MNKWAKNYKKTMGRERGPLTRQSGPQHSPKIPTKNPRSGGQKPSPTSSRAAGAGPGKMDAQDASRLRFGPTTRPRKANKKIYMLTKYGPIWTKFGHTCARGVGTPLLAPLWPIFLQKAHADTLWSVQRCVGAINVLKDGCVVGLGHSREEYSMGHSPSPLL
jgi:hypothetical protein